MTNDHITGTAPKGSAFFVFREKDGRFKALSWKRWCIADSEIIAWAHTLKEARAIVAELKRKEEELPL